MSQVHTEIRRPRAEGQSLFLVGPGGVGKSTLGRELSRRLGWLLIDLDLEFCARFEVIGPYIARHGYARYRAANLALADQLVAETSAPVVFVASSGFLAGPVGSADHSASRRLVQSGFAITLLPSLDIDTATDIVVARQLGRGFGFERETEERKFRERFCIYRSEGAMLVVSVAPPEVVAEVVLTRLSLG